MKLGKKVKTNRFGRNLVYLKWLRLFGLDISDSEAKVCAAFLTLDPSFESDRFSTIARNIALEILHKAGMSLNRKTLNAYINTLKKKGIIKYDKYGRGTFNAELIPKIKESKEGKYLFAILVEEQ